MPLYPNSRYNPLYGYPPQVSPGLLSPDVGDSSSPAFDPTMAALAQNQQAPPLPPPPQTQPAPQRLNDTAAGASIQNLPPLTPPNGQFPAGGSARDTGVKQLLAKSMPPPGMAPASTPDVAAAPDSIEAAPEPTAADVTAGAPASSQELAVDPKLAAYEAQSTELQQKHAGRDAQGNKIAEGNESPKSNWLQRLSSALLAMTKFAPYSDQIVHPKWTAQERQYQRQQGDIAQQEKMIEQANTSQAAVEQKLGTYAWRKGQEAKNVADAAELAAKPGQISAAQKEKDLKDSLDFYNKHTDQISKAGGQILPDGMQVPPEWAQIPINNPENGQKELWVQPPLLTSIQNEDPALAAELIKRHMITQEQANLPMAPAPRKAYRDMLQDARKDEANNASKVPANVPVEQQFINEYIKKHPGASIEDALKAHASIQAPQRAPEQLMQDPSGRIFAAAPGMTITPGSRPLGAADKDDNASRAAAFKSYSPALDSAERFNVMTKNYEDAIKNHDQQAMLSLLANHLGMTMGLQKGARLNQAMISEAQKSTPWLQGMAAKFDRDGYLSGVTLAPEQMRQMVNLGRERYTQDLSKARSEAKYMGAHDDGPDRVPNQSTVNHYFNIANGDVARAKQLLAEDGWRVK